eukprot:2840167-Lingulodinium_polyedra.AAC.1
MAVSRSNITSCSQKTARALLWCLCGRCSGVACVTFVGWLTAGFGVVWLKCCSSAAWVLLGCCFYACDWMMLGR